VRVTLPSRSPFASVVGSVLLALLYLAAALVWVVFGPSLPGGRWLAVHLFTLGVLSNLVLAMTRHFAVTLTRSATAPTGAVVPLFNAGTVAVLVGVASSARWLVAVGASVATVAVLVAYRELRRMRRGSLGARFAWIVRLYERAHGAFLHGAALGLLMGVGALGGTWYGSARLAHLHVNVLGWGGLTLLATLVFFGPTVVRQRIEDGADDRAARVLRHGATGLTVGTLLLLATGVGGGWVIPLRIAAACALAVLAWAASVTCSAVLRTVLRSTVAGRWAVGSVAIWLPALLWLDVAVVATGTWRHLDALGLAALVGVLLQSIVVTLLHLAPTFVANGGAREQVRAALDRLGGVRTLVFNLGVVALVAAAGGGTALGLAGPIMARAGGVLVVAAVSQPVVAVLRARRLISTPVP